MSYIDLSKRNIKVDNISKTYNNSNWDVTMDLLMKEHTPIPPSNINNNEIINNINDDDDDDNSDYNIINNNCIYQETIDYDDELKEIINDLQN